MGSYRSVAIVRAAGGLLWRPSPSGPRIALVHRPRRDDWSLPKGKLDDGEGWEEAALREVEEETGCVPRLGAFAGATSYFAKKAPKLVLYWHMTLVRNGKLDAGDEIDEVAWMTPEEALARLDYEVDRRLVRRAPPGGAAPADSRGEKGAAPVAAERADLLRRVMALGSRDGGTGLGPALELLDEAERTTDPAGQRILLLAARRLALLSVEEPEASKRADALREEARTLSPWRRKAIRKVLPEGEPVSGEALFVAASIRDEEEDGRRPALQGPPRGWVLPVVALAATAALVSAAAVPELRTPILAGGAAGALGGAAVLVAGRRAGAGRRGR